MELMKPISELKELIQKIETQKGLMIAVATGGPKIKDVNAQYQHRDWGNGDGSI